MNLPSELITFQALFIQSFIAVCSILTIYFLLKKDVFSEIKFFWFNYRTVPKINRWVNEYLKQWSINSQTKIKIGANNYETEYEIGISADVKELHNNKPAKSLIRKIVTAGITQQIATELTEKGFDRDSIHEFTGAAAEEFLNNYVAKRTELSDETIKKLTLELGTTSNNDKKEAVRKILPKVKTLLASKGPIKSIQKEYETIAQSTAREQNILEIIRRIRRIKELNAGEFKKGDSLQFKRETQDFLTELKKSRLNSLTAFYQKAEQVTNRAGSLYAFILENPGKYLKEISKESTIPYGTVPRYALALEKHKLVIRDEVGTTVEQYPFFSQEELIRSAKELIGYRVCLKGKIKITNGVTQLEGYENIQLSLPEDAVGKIILLKGTIHTNGRLSVINATTKIL